LLTHVIVLAPFLLCFENQPHSRCVPVTTDCMPLSLRNGKWRIKQALIAPSTLMASWMLVRQRGVDGELLKRNWSSIALEEAAIPILSFGEVVGEAQQATTKRTKEQKGQTDEQHQHQQHRLPPHRHPGRSQPLTQSSLWALIVAATDEMYSIAEKLHPKLEAEVRCCTLMPT